MVQRHVAVAFFDSMAGPMHSNLPSNIIPIGFCVVAIIALTAAGFVLFDAHEELASDEASPPEFTAYQSGDSPPPHDTAGGDDDRHEDPTALADRIDWEQIADDEQWEILSPSTGDDEPPRDDAEPTSQRGEKPPSTNRPAGNQRHQGPTGRIVVITNFTRADVTINGEPYHPYSDDGENRGMELPAHQVHEVFVEFDGNEKLYELDLRPGERRMLMVELTGMGQGQASSRDRPTRPRRPRQRDTSDEEQEDIDDDEGRITVYSRPRGEIYVGQESTGEQTPGTVDVEPGRHEVQVEYREDEMSETKTVRVREGSRVKLFFREDD